MAKRRNTSKSTARPRPPVGGRIADRRKEFERRTKESGSDQAAVRAFIEGKMAMMRSDPKLTEVQKVQALRDLQRKLDQLPR